MNPENPREFSLPSISRKELQGDDNALVSVAPTRPEGIEFLYENHAWGFPRMSLNPQYMGIYVSGNVKRLEYIGEVDEIITADSAKLAKPAQEYEYYNSSGKVIYFKPDELYQLEDPLPFASRVLYPPQRYTSLYNIKVADTIDDIL